MRYSFQQFENRLEHSFSVKSQKEVYYISFLVRNNEVKKSFCVWNYEGKVYYDKYYINLLLFAQYYNLLTLWGLPYRKLPDIFLYKADHLIESQVPIAFICDWIEEQGLYEKELSYIRLFIDYKISKIKFLPEQDWVDYEVYINFEP